MICAFIIIGNSGSAATVCRSWVKPDLSSIPINSKIKSATLKLYCITDGSGNERAYRVYRMLRAVAEGTGNNTVTNDGVSWNTYDGVNNWQTVGGFGALDCEQTDIGSRTFSATETTSEYKEFILNTDKISEIVNGTFTNNGFLLKADTENTDRYTFNSGESATNKPILTVEYKYPL